MQAVCATFCVRSTAPVLHYCNQSSLTTNLMGAQAPATSGQQLPMPPASSITSLHLRPQLDQYNDMARFLGYSSGLTTLPAAPQDPCNSPQARPSQTVSQNASPAHPEPKTQATQGAQAGVSYVGLYPNDHAVDLPACKPHQAAPVTAPDSTWEMVQQPAASSASSTSTSSRSSKMHSSPGRKLAERQPDRQDESQPDRHHDGQPEGQLDRQTHMNAERQAEGQPDRQQFQTPARVAASPFLADAEHSFAPVPIHSLQAFTSPFMADAAHSFVPQPVATHQAATTSWEPFGPPTFPSGTPVSSNTQGSTASTQRSPASHPASHSSSDVGTGPPAPSDYISYLELLGARQFANQSPSSQQPHDTQPHQAAQAQMHSPHGQYRQQQQGQDRPQHMSAQRTSVQQQGQAQNRQQHRQNAGQHQEGHLWQVRPSPFSQPAEPSQQTPAGPNSNPPPGNNAPAAPSRSAFNSFDTFPSGEPPQMSLLAR